MDAKNCGACGKACASGEICSGGACEASGCAAGLSDCDGQAMNGCEYDNADLASDVQNCGACAHTCTTPQATPLCKAGACAIGACDAGFADCNGLVLTNFCIRRKVTVDRWAQQRPQPVVESGWSRLRPSEWRKGSGRTRGSTTAA